MMQTLLFATETKTDDPSERKHGGSPTSAAAWTAPGKTTLREQVYGFVLSRGLKGATLHEACLALGKPANSLSGRFFELVQAGRLIRTDRTRPSPSGCQEAVYIVMP
jgi:hypothetical protein